MASEAPRTGSAPGVLELTEDAVRSEFALIMEEWGYSHAPDPTIADIKRAVARANGELPAFDPSQVHGVR